MLLLLDAKWVPGLRASPSARDDGSGGYEQFASLLLDNEWVLPDHVGGGTVVGFELEESDPFEIAHPMPQHF